jgi:hypothetical protein
VADAAEAKSHHPDIDIRWNNKVTLTLTTHSADRFSTTTPPSPPDPAVGRDHHHPPGMAGP